MAFTIPEGLHEDLYPLAWLVGTWRGKGRGEYPGITPFQFAHEVTFNHDGRDFLNYYSRSWILDEKDEIVSASESEVGFWRTKPKIQLAMDQGYSSPSSKIVTAGSRLYGLVEGELFFAYDMAAEGQTIQAHIWSTMERQQD